MLGPTKVAVSFVLVALSLMMEGTITNAESKLPDLINADVAEKLFRLDCDRSLANDESVWTPGRKRRTQYRIFLYLLAYKTWKRMAALGYGCS